MHSDKFRPAPPRLIFVPVSVLGTIARLFCKSGIAEEMCGSLQADISKTRNQMDWSPPVTVEEALYKTEKYFLSQ